MFFRMVLFFLSQFTRLTFDGQTDRHLSRD